MNDNERQKIALFRYGIIAPAVSGTYDEALSLKGFFRDASKKVYSNPRGEDTMISASTIERWYYAYMDAGLMRCYQNAVLTRVNPASLTVI